MSKRAKIAYVRSDGDGGQQLVLVDDDGEILWLQLTTATAAKLVKDMAWWLFDSLARER